MANFKYNKNLMEEYKYAHLTPEERVISTLFNFNRRELIVLGHNKLAQLYEVTKDLDRSHPIYWGYVTRPIEGYTSSLKDVLINETDLTQNNVTSQINMAYNKSLERKHNINPL